MKKNKKILLIIFIILILSLTNNIFAEIIEGNTKVNIFIPNLREFKTQAQVEGYDISKYNFESTGYMTTGKSSTVTMKDAYIIADMIAKFSGKQKFRSFQVKTNDEKYNSEGQKTYDFNKNNDDEISFEIICNNCKFSFFDEKIGTYEPNTNINPNDLSYNIEYETPGDMYSKIETVGLNFNPNENVGIIPENKKKEILEEYNVKSISGNYYVFKNQYNEIMIIPEDSNSEIRIINQQGDVLESHNNNNDFYTKITNRIKPNSELDLDDLNIDDIKNKYEKLAEESDNIENIENAKEKIKSKIQEDCVNKPVECNKNNPKTYSWARNKLGFKIDKNELKTLTNNLKKAQKKYDACIKDKTNNEDCKNELEKLNDIKAITTSLSSDEYINMLSSVCKDPNSENCKSAVDSFQSKKCKDATFEGLCKFFSTSNSNSLIQQNMYKELNKINSQNENKEDNNQQINQFLANKVDGLTYYNNNNKFKIDNEEFDNIHELKQHYETKCNSGNNESACKTLNNKIIPATQQTKVTPNWMYTVFSAIKISDTAKDIMYLFGTESNYEEVGSDLRESIPSQICKDKIDGYIDEKQVTNGGTTKYGCEYNKTEEIDTRCVEVIYDLRAQRTPITPDGKVMISYSYYLKKPTNPSKLYISYLKNNNEREKIIETNLSLKNYNSVNIPLNNTKKIDPKSFKIHIKTPTVTAEYPIIPIS